MADATAALERHGTAARTRQIIAQSKARKERQEGQV